MTDSHTRLATYPELTIQNFCSQKHWILILDLIEKKILLVNCNNTKSIMSGDLVFPNVPAYGPNGPSVFELTSPSIPKRESKLEVYEQYRLGPLLSHKFDLGSGGICTPKMQAPENTNSNFTSDLLKGLRLSDVDLVPHLYLGPITVSVQRGNSLHEICHCDFQMHIFARELAGSVNFKAYDGVYSPGQEVDEFHTASTTKFKFLSSGLGQITSLIDGKVYVLIGVMGKCEYFAMAKTLGKSKLNLSEYRLRFDPGTSQSTSTCDPGSLYAARYNIDLKNKCLPTGHAKQLRPIPVEVVQEIRKAYKILCASQNLALGIHLSVSFHPRCYKEIQRMMDPDDVIVSQSQASKKQEMRRRRNWFCCCGGVLGSFFLLRAAASN